MKTTYYYYCSIVIFTCYLIWVWFIGVDKSMIPDVVRSAWYGQDFSHWLFSFQVELYIFYFRMLLAFSSLTFLLFHHEYGRWGFLVFSISGPLLHTSGWVYKPNYLVDLEWGIVMMQGGLIAICFIGDISKKFTWSFIKIIHVYKKRLRGS